MSFLSMRIGFLFLVAAFFQSGSCNQCQDLEPGDISNFDIKKYAGKYQAVMGILSDGPLSKLEWKCNRLDFIPHTHRNGGVNVAATFYSDNDRSLILDTALLYTNSTTNPYMKDAHAYYQTLKMWANVELKVLQASQASRDLFVYQFCMHNIDDVSDAQQFYVLVLRREGSTLPVTQVQALLPESIKNNPALVKLCKD